MELDNRGLARVERAASPRDVWTTEAGDFTPWLADNLDVLADELGMTLTYVGREEIVGGFRLDIRAEDDYGGVVVIENQLGRTDHNHLGQCLVYASGLDASTVVWIAAEFREEYRRAFDWLNERTDLGISFFGVEVSVVQIGDGPRAPWFEVVSQPNETQKTAKTDARLGAGGASTSPVNARRQEFFGEILADVVDRRPAIRMPAKGRRNWVSFSSGTFGNWALVANQSSELQIEAYLDTGDEEVNKALFDHFHGEREHWEAEVGFELDWQRLDDRRASRIAVLHDLDLEDGASVNEVRLWATDALVAMHGALNSALRSKATELKAAASVSR